jgi:DnaJ family protein C protein 11
LERSTIPESEQSDTVVLSGEKSASRPGRQPVAVTRTYYELLCLPQTSSLSREEIRAAYYRMFHLLHPEKQAQHLHLVSDALFNSVQEAFETLVEPHRRVNYDLSVAHPIARADEFEVAEVTSEPGDDLSYEEQLRQEYLNMAFGEARTTTELGLRLQPKTVFSSRRGGARTTWPSLTPVDLFLRQSATLSAPVLGEAIEKLYTSTQDAVAAKVPSVARKHPVHFATPTVTLTGSVHGLMDEALRLGPHLQDYYQPPAPSIHGPRRLAQLLSSRFVPTLNVKVRQEVSVREKSVLPDTVVEQEVELLPFPTVTTRVGHSVPLPDGPDPLDVEVSVQKTFSAGSGPPTMGLALHRRFHEGTAFVAVDAGDWTLWPAQECREYSKFSKVAGRVVRSRDAFRHPPTVEVGYTVSATRKPGLRSGGGYTKPADRGVRGMDEDSHDDSSGSWTASVGATADNLAAYLRYGWELFSTVPAPQKGKLPSGNRGQRAAGICAEVELGGSRERVFVVALRALKRVGRFSKVGFEVGVTQSNLHVSLYWSRLGQRLSIPVLLATKATMSTELVFWSAFVPFIGFAAMEILYWRPREQIRSRRLKDISKYDLHEYIARRRAEADELTVVLAAGVEHHQKVEKHAGGLVILSAKYAVRGAAPEEIADVTVAIAALVDGGKLFIPKGLRKSHLLGFWDPSPCRTKVLTVRYLYKGQEHVVEVSGREELRLP